LPEMRVPIARRRQVLRGLWSGALASEAGAGKSKFAPRKVRGLRRDGPGRVSVLRGLWCAGAPSEAGTNGARNPGRNVLDVRPDGSDKQPVLWKLRSADIAAETPGSAGRSKHTTNQVCKLWRNGFGRLPVLRGVRSAGAPAGASAAAT
jgi:hypothetical protein